MGLLFWRKGKNAVPSDKGPADASSPGTAEGKEVAGMHGAVEVRRPTEVTVFEFGSTKVSGERITLAGYCPVSDELEPCRWEIVPALQDNAPQFRIVF
ncbi:allyl alcohol dehydrogenase-like protein [Carex rostrata]